MLKSLEVFNEIAQKLLQAEKYKPVANHIVPQELPSAVDITLSKDPISERDFKDSLSNLVLATPRTASNAFFNQLYGGRNETATLGDLLAVLMNTSMYTYKVAGAQVGVEKEILRQVSQLIGWSPNKADGTFASGGSLTNFMSLLMARDAYNENIKHKGLHQKLTVYTSDKSHYSIPKNAAFAGIGSENVRMIPTNKYGQIRTDLLTDIILQDIEEGYHPIMVNATCGTTVLGVYDDLEALAPICKRFSLWLHADGAYGGSVIFSDKYKHLVKGLEFADSFSFNAHKMLGTPLTCSIIITRHKKQLNNSFAYQADYLYQSESDEFNLGQNSLQCGRRNDALKFWTLWKSVGTSGLAQIVEQQFHLADVARKYVKNHPDYTFHSYDDSISVCFNYKGINAVDLCYQLHLHNQLLVSHGTFEGEEFVRLVTINAQNTEYDIINFFKVLEEFADSTYF